MRSQHDHVGTVFLTFTNNCRYLIVLCNDDGGIDAFFMEPCSNGQKFGGFRSLGERQRIFFATNIFIGEKCFGFGQYINDR